MIATPASLASLTPSSDPARLHALSDEELDLLPYGVICLDPGGKILRYNLAEARFARLDRDQVLGRAFFGQVAPCTATPEFQGRFLRFVEPGNLAPLERFSYVFDFRFGAQEIEAELVRPPTNDCVYVCVNRKRFLPPRSSVPTPVKAPLLRELDPEGERLGVRRDGRERREIVLTPSFFSSLWAAGDKAPFVSAETVRLLESWGTGWGRLTVVDLETEALEQHGKLLRELPMARVAERLSGYLHDHGLGQLTTDFGPARQGAFVLHLDRSVTASRGGAPGRRCSLFSGFFSALFSHLAGRRLAVREAACLAEGADRCSFVVASQSREAQLLRAVEVAGGEVNDVLRALSESP